MDILYYLLAALVIAGFVVLWHNRAVVKAKLDVWAHGGSKAVTAELTLAEHAEQMLVERAAAQAHADVFAKHSAAFETKVNAAKADLAQAMNRLVPPVT